MKNIYVYELWNWNVSIFDMKFVDRFHAISENEIFRYKFGFRVYFLSFFFDMRVLYVIIQWNNDKKKYEIINERHFYQQNANHLYYSCFSFDVFL